jgi:dihydrolipoamide dehydrogenase
VSSDLEVRVPDIGDFTDVPVIEIHVSPGDAVAVEDPLVTLESDKATMDVPAPGAGTVKQLGVKIGDRVSEGSLLLVLEAVQAASTPAAAPAGEGDAGAASAGAASAAASPAAASPSPAPASATPPAPSSSPSASSPAAPPTRPAGADAPEFRASSPATGFGAGPRSSDGAGAYDTQLLVLGSGPGGYTAAFRAADLGLRTTLVERYDKLGGVCLNVGCIPSKALLHAARVIAETEEMAEHGITFGPPKIDAGKLLTWKQSVVDRLTGGLAALAKQRKVDVVHGVAKFTGPHSISLGERDITFEHCIIAAGSQAAAIPGLPDDDRIIDSTAALSPRSIPKRLLVIGGGIIGLEMATVYNALGSRIAVVELMDQLIPGCDADLVSVLHRRIEERYDAVLLETSVSEVTAQKSGLKVTFSTGDSQTFDQILVAVGRRPNGHAIEAASAGVEIDPSGFIPVDRQLRTNVRHIHAIGDIVGGPMLAHKASHEGKVAAEVIYGMQVEFDVRAIPSVAYTDPEIAWMGMTETEARSQGTELEKGVFPWSASGRALGLGRAEGLTKLLFEPGSRRLLGAGIVGVNAGDLIAETVHALEMGADAEDVALTVHPHPTLSETIMFAAEMAAGTITDLMPPRRRAGVA